jgi:two-component system, OmpR family, sensor histidine kinase KdpD
VRRSHAAWRQAAVALCALAAATLVMLAFRARLDKAHVAMIYLLVVLGGSAAGGRFVGLVLGSTAFLAFDFLFLRPYYTLAIADPLDWLVLFTFLVTSIVAAELLDRLRRHAELAEQRAVELDRLSTLGAETLNAARAEQALVAIATVIRSAVSVERCALFVSEGASLRSVAGTDVGGSDHTLIDADSLLEYVVRSGQAAIEREDGTLHLLSVNRPQEPAIGLHHVKAFALPLSIRGETVGALRLSAAVGFSLTAEHRRVLLALAYYAALGIERLRLERTEETAEALRRADVLKDALLASVSHDLRTPLTTIKGIAHEIRHGGEASRAGVIEEEADRLSALVDGLLQLSQLDAGALPVAIELNTVDDVIGAALQRATAVLGAHRVDVVLGDEDMLVGRFDFGHTLRILVNLLENAAKYSPPTAPITVTARRRDRRIDISVADRGVGIDHAEREKIFHPFYRIPGAVADVRGAGLGLAIARRLAEAQGGRLSVAPDAASGSRFTLDVEAAELPSD